jgi:hypothetical protein
LQVRPQSGLLAEGRSNTRRRPPEPAAIPDGRTTCCGAAVSLEGWASEELGQLNRSRGEIVSAPAEPRFDKQDQYDRIRDGLLPGESVLSVYDRIGAGTGFVGLTDRRVILQDNSFVGKKVALTSVPYSRVQSVSFVSNKSMLGKWSSSSEVAILVGGATDECEFRGHDKAQVVHDTILRHILG